MPVNAPCDLDEQVRSCARRVRCFTPVHHKPPTMSAKLDHISWRKRFVVLPLISSGGSASAFCHLWKTSRSLPYKCSSEWTFRLCVLNGWLKCTLCLIRWACYLLWWQRFLMIICCSFQDFWLHLALTQAALDILGYFMSNMFAKSVFIPKTILSEMRHF